jgi:hypothetical protein
VFQVTKATEVARLDQRRLLLSINHKGTILQVNPGKHCPATESEKTIACKLSQHGAL